MMHRHECHECLKHGSTDIERDRDRIEVVIEMRAVLLSRFTIMNNEQTWWLFPLSETVSQLATYFSL